MNVENDYGYNDESSDSDYEDERDKIKDDRYKLIFKLKYFLNSILF